MNRALVDYIPETEAFGDETSILGEVSGQAFLDEFDEMDLAADLLEIRDEVALDQFVTRLLQRRARDDSQEPQDVAAQALRPILKNAAVRAIPRRRGQAQQPRSTTAGRPENEAALYFGLDPEGLSDEDREFEVARSFVRFADAALREAAGSDPEQAPSRDRVRRAVLLAARRHAPGLLRALGGARPSGAPRSPSTLPTTGRWQRQGRNLVIVGC